MFKKFTKELSKRQNIILDLTQIGHSADFSIILALFRSVKDHAVP